MVPLAQAASVAGGAIAGITDPGAAPQISGINSTTEQAGMISAPFGDLLADAVSQVDSLERQARSSVEGLMSGAGVDVHEAMIAAEKAKMGFELVLSVRNKALAAYQQVMGMQF